MRPLRSITGAAFAILYGIAFVAVYVNYRNHAGEWFADTPLVLGVALPFVLTMRFLSGGSYDMTGDDTLKVIAAGLFCCALAWVVGALLGSIGRMAFGRARRRGAR